MSDRAPWATPDEVRAIVREMIENTRVENAYPRVASPYLRLVPPSEPKDAAQPKERQDGDHLAADTVNQWAGAIPAPQRETATGAVSVERQAHLIALSCCADIHQERCEQDILALVRREVEAHVTAHDEDLRTIRELRREVEQREKRIAELEEETDRLRGLLYANGPINQEEP